MTPLLNQWTYQAMVHELMGIDNNRVDLSYMADAKPELRDVVLSPSADPFFHENQFANFGETAEAVRVLLAKYQAVRSVHENIKTLGACVRRRRERAVNALILCPLCAAQRTCSALLTTTRSCAQRQTRRAST